MEVNLTKTKVIVFMNGGSHVQIREILLERTKGQDSYIL